MAKLTNTIIEAAIHGFEAQKKELDAQINELRAMITDDGEMSSGEKPRTKTGRRKFSAATRKKMKAAQLLRWAKLKSEPAAAAAKPVKVAKATRKLSAEGRKAISMAMKKRWAAKKAAAA